MTHARARGSPLHCSGGKERSTRAAPRASFSPQLPREDWPSLPAVSGVPDMFWPGRHGSRQTNGTDEGSLLVVDEERRVAPATEVDDVADPELDQEPDVDLEPADSKRKEEPRADSDASTTSGEQGFTAER